MTQPKEPRIFRMEWKEIHNAYIAKAERKSRTREEVDELISWLTGYDAEGIISAGERSVREFFDEVPALNPDRFLITGSVCGVKVQEVENPLMQKIRQLDKLIDELAKGKALEKIKRSGA
ncbi:DUF2200 domain-containing protein [Corynebacterium striatum]|uniref:DUF2200 domain-containing protein n=1 Tax=Corynebacterium striatum TaxID=43770 RepID=UPI001A2A7C58|nr:DUF2200 domain-containing protein [Corynebacterium striatum]MDC7106589.1 DUF2200 domain-containing protein [Corynebacterium striatum]HAT1211635.1 DUF2200 domain-containing protein [Corynebacterium striatum]HAT1476077.1 DUF2200 domain-containing protein [Corynebacterium striatum]HAT6526551.1 DUF2200 domain-containing protein [Corynebacterium striatum]HAT6564685.1 DUF2200 domain-containing protein [Corynebacterium striatum]